MRPVDVGSVEDFPDRAMTVVEVDGTEVGVCRWGSEFFAMRNRCPHQGGPVCSGFLQARLAGRCTAEGVEMEATPGEPVILCAWHRWEFSVRTGESAWDPRYKVRTYPVDVDGGRVLVRVGRGGRDG
ncbi:MAG: Rieske 2Fe-2S domain-containing protein [Streptosporangiales bacterium]|nr:Rieske 2Fe-2S domain-containing protein [Streptosporangiales bacterium]